MIPSQNTKIEKGLQNLCWSRIGAFACISSDSILRFCYWKYSGDTHYAKAKL